MVESWLALARCNLRLFTVIKANIGGCQPEWMNERNEPWNGMGDSLSEPSPCFVSILWHGIIGEDAVFDLSKLSQSSERNGRLSSLFGAIIRIIESWFMHRHKYPGHLPGLDTKGNCVSRPKLGSHDELFKECLYLSEQFSLKLLQRASSEPGLLFELFKEGLAWIDFPGGLFQRIPRWIGLPSELYQRSPPPGIGTPSSEIW